MPLILIPFAIFLACVFGQMWALRRVRQALAQRHPELWLEMSYKAWSIDRAVYHFAFSSKHHALDDPILTDRIWAVRLVLAVAMLALIAVVPVAILGGNFTPA